MKLILFVGQSLGAAMFTAAYHHPTPLAGTHLWSGSAWVAPIGDGAIEYANRIKAATGDDVYLVNACVNGLPLLPVSGGASWTSTGAGSAAANAIAQAQAALASVSGLALDRVEFWGCQSDCLALAYSDMYSAISGGLSTLLGLLRAGLGNDFRLAVWPVGKVASGGLHQTVRAQMVYSANTSLGLEPGPATHDLAYADGTHLQDSQYLAAGIRGAMNAISYFAAKAIGAHTVNHFGAGPQVSKIVRLNNMALIYIDVKPGAYLQPLNPWASGDLTLTTNWGLFWGIGTFDQLTIVDAHIIGGMVRLASDTSLVWPIAVGHAQERTWSGLDVYDSNGQVLLPHTQEMLSSA